MISSSRFSFRPTFALLVFALFYASGALAQNLRPYVLKPQLPSTTSAPPIPSPAPPIPPPPPPPPPQVAGETPKEPPAALLEICNYFAQTPSQDSFDSETNYWTQRLTYSVSTWDVVHPGIARPIGDVFTPTWALGACAQIYDTLAKQSSDVDAALGHRELVEMDFNLARLGAWLTKAGKRGTDPRARAEATAAQLHVDNAVADLHDFMELHGLLNRFSAAVFFGTGIGSSGQIVAGGSDAVKNRISEQEQVLPISTFTLESTHYGWRGEHSWDASFRAHAGFQPVLNIVKASLDSDPATAPAALVAVLQPALVTDFGARTGMPFNRIDGEFSFVGMIGANRLTTDPVTFDDKKPALIATSVSDASTKTAWFSELGTEFTLFDNPVRVLHAEKGLVTPVVKVAGGYRYDSRFSSANLPGLTADPNRLYFRAMIDLNKATSQRALADPAKTFDLGIGIEYDRPLHSSSQVPSNTRFVIRGDINVLKASSGDDSKKAPAATGDTAKGSNQ